MNINTDNNSYIYNVNMIHIFNLAIKHLLVYHQGNKTKFHLCTRPTKVSHLFLHETRHQSTKIYD